MPSPFPGMDPYLEHPTVFPGLHDSFVTYLRETLQENLPPPYYADIGDRLWVEVSDRLIGPDVDVKHPADTRFGRGNGGVATATRTEPVVIHVPHDEFREPFVEIYSRGEEERVVATIEVLSLTNKTPGAHGRDLYLRKQKEILSSQVHLVEIDLLRGGQHTTAVPLDRLRRKVEEMDYHVCIHHFDNLEDYFVYPFSLRNSLPDIAIPLLPGDGSVVTDLQQVFQRCYETGPYTRRIRYRDSQPVPPLPETLQSWAGKLVAGLPK